jgi:sugar phosphate isomerase/epimerase
MMKIACGYTIPITKYGLPPSSKDNLKAMQEIREAGFQAVEMELFAGKMEDYVRDFDRLKKTLGELDLKICCVMAVVENMFTIDKEKKNREIESFKQIADMTRELGSPFLSICAYLPQEIEPVRGTELYTGGPPTQVRLAENFSWPEFWKNVVDQFSKCADIAKERGLQFLIETRAQDFMSDTDIMNLIRESDRVNTGVILDVAHLHATKEFLELAIAKMGSLIKHVHLADNDGTQAYHYPPDKGNINFERIVKALKKIGYNDYLVVDIAGVDNILEEAVKAKNYFESRIKGI